MKQFLLVLFTIYLCSKSSFQQSPLLETLSPQGHVLDCLNRCKLCADEEKDFNPLYAEYVKKLKNKDTDFKKDDLMKLVKDKVTPKRKTRVSSLATENNSTGELTEEVKLKEELAKSEELLDQEVKNAVDKVISVEGEMKSDKIQEIGSKIRQKLVDKYRVEAAKRLGINLEKLKEKEKEKEKEKDKAKDSKENDVLGNLNLRLSSKRSSRSKSRSKNRRSSGDALNTIIFYPICVISGSIFYA